MRAFEMKLRVYALAGGLLLGACGVSLPRLVEGGRYEEAIARANAAKRPPRGNAARAWARALVATGQVEAAQAVLIRDFRRGGDVKSLLALADLEHAQGMAGLAAHHYARIVALAPAQLGARPDACALLSSRVRLLAMLGEADAAAFEHDRLRQACPAPEALPPTTPDPVVGTWQAESMAPDDLERRLKAAATPQEKRTEAARWNATLVPADVLAILGAELRGELDLEILPDHELRRLVGAAGWADFEPLLAALSEEDRAFAQLRLRRVMVDAPRVDEQSDELDLHRAAEAAGAEAWRIYGWHGHLASAELMLKGSLRSKLPTGASNSPNAAQEPGGGAAPGSADWTTALDLTPRNLGRTIMLARFRDLAGSPQQSLELARAVLSRAHAEGRPHAITAARRQALHELALGRPWRALAMLEAVPSADLDDVRSAAASAVLLTAALCGADCSASPEGDTEAASSMLAADQTLVESVLGAEFVAQTRRRLTTWAFRSSGAEASECPGLDALRDPDDRDPLAKALQAALDEPRETNTVNLLRDALVAQPLVACNGEVVVPLLLTADAKLTAASISELLAHDPGTRASAELAVQAELAMVADQESRAELLAVAAAASADDPRAMWARLARTAARSGQRTLLRRALREVILNAPGLADEEARRRLVLVALADAARSPGVVSETMRQALRGHIEEYVRAHPKPQQWWAKESLALAIAERPWNQDVRDELASLLFATEDERNAHARAVALLAGVEPEVNAWDDVILARSLAATGRPLPPATLALGGAATFERSRLAAARSAKEPGEAEAYAIGLAVTATAQARAQAVAQALAKAAPAHLAAVRRWVLQKPMAVNPRREGAVGVIEHEDVRQAVLFGLDLESTFVAR